MVLQLQMQIAIVLPRTLLYCTLTCPIFFGIGTDPIRLLIFFLLLWLGEEQERLRLHRLKSDRYEIWHDCSSNDIA